MGKREVRQIVWTRFRERGIERFPGARGRIPNFEGAVEAARRLDEVPVWAAARVLKCNPDYSQLPVRARAFTEGKTLYVAVPRLRHERCFLELDPRKIQENPWKVVTIRGAARHGRPVGPDEIRRVDLVVCGSVAVTRRGARVGKGGGFSDLEYALGRAYGFLDGRTPTLTTVHAAQVFEQEIALGEHDFPLDWIVTPERVIETRTDLPRPEGVVWDLLEEGRIAKVPALERLRRRSGLVPDAS